MKIRDLMWRAGSITVPAWPPLRWSPKSYRHGNMSPLPGDGIFQSLARLENDTVLELTMKCDAYEYTGRLMWDAPPLLVAVESLLRANLGQEIRTIAELDV